MRQRDKNAFMGTWRMTAICLIVSVFAIAVLTFRGVHAQSDDGEKPRFKVNASKGLNMRKSPSETAPVIALLPDGSSVLIESVVPRKATAGGRQGYWLSVSWKEKTGYVFSAFLKKDFSASFRFKSTYDIASYFPFAEQQEAELTFYKGNIEPVFARGAISFTEPLPPVWEAVATISGFKKAIDLKDGYRTVVRFVIDSVKVTVDGEMSTFAIRGHLVSVKEEKLQ